MRLWANPCTGGLRGLFDAVLSAPDSLVPSGGVAGGARSLLRQKEIALALPPPFPGLLQKAGSPFQKAGRNAL